MKDAAGFVEKHGVVMQSARHAQIPSLAEHVAGEKIRGSWWAHAKGQQIFRALVAVYDSPDVVALKLVDGKLTLVHRRLWPALATLAYDGRIDKTQLTKVTQEHTASGRHEKHEEQFPLWLPRGLKLPSVEEALSQLGALRDVLLPRPDDGARRSPASAGRAARARRR
ncbi:MAG: hypothetical protein JWM53_547 [bacterium]|nr:hypothetical protein [bacterium]